MQVPINYLFYRVAYICYSLTAKVLQCGLQPDHVGVDYNAAIFKPQHLRHLINLPKFQIPY